MGTTEPEVLYTPLSQTVWDLTAVGDSSGCLTVHEKGSRRAVKELPETDTCYVCGTCFALGLETARMLYPFLDSLMAKGRHCEITSYSVALTNKPPPPHSHHSLQLQWLQVGESGSMFLCFVQETEMSYSVVSALHMGDASCTAKSQSCKTHLKTKLNGKCYILMWSTF